MPFPLSEKQYIASHNLNEVKFSTREAEHHPIDLPSQLVCCEIPFLSKEIEKESGLVLTHREGSPGLFFHLLNRRFVH